MKFKNLPVIIWIFFFLIKWIRIFKIMYMYVYVYAYLYKETSLEFIWSWFSLFLLGYTSKSYFI